MNFYTALQWLIYFSVMSGLFIFATFYFVWNLEIKKIANHILDKSLALTVIIFILALTLLSGDLQIAVYTFSSVYFGFWLNAKIASRAERQKAKIYLGLIWQELLYNSYQLEQLKKNYRFNVGQIEFLPINFIRFNNLLTSVSFLKNEIYQSYIMSGAITTLSANILKNTKESDELFNSIESTYTDIQHLKSIFSFIKTDFETKLKIQREMPALAQDKNLTDKVAVDIEAKIKRVAMEIAVTYRDTVNTIAKVVSALEKLNVKQTEASLTALKSDILLDEDKEFEEQSIRDIPQNVVDDPFQQ